MASVLPRSRQLLNCECVSRLKGSNLKVQILRGHPSSSTCLGSQFPGTRTGYATIICTMTGQWTCNVSCKGWLYRRVPCIELDDTRASVHPELYSVGLSGFVRGNFDASRPVNHDRTGATIAQMAFAIVRSSSWRFSKRALFEALSCFITGRLPLGKKQSYDTIKRGARSGYM